MGEPVAAPEHRQPECEDKLNQDAYDTNAKILDQNDALANQHKIDLQTLGLGTKERQRQLDLLSIETARQKELAEWRKRAVGLKLDGSQQDVDERAAINKRYDVRRDETQSYFNASDIANGDWVKGAKGGLQDVIDKTNDLASAANNTAQNAISGIGDAFADLATTGKLSFANLTNSIVASFVKMTTEALVAKSAMSFLDWAGLGASGTTSFAGAFHLAGGGSVSGPGTSTSDSIPAMLSDGEYVLNAAAVDRIGVRRLDALNTGASIDHVARYATGGVVGAASTVQPSGGGDISFEVVNNSDSQVQKPQVSTDASGRRFVRMIIDQAKSEIAGDIAGGQGSASKALSQRFGLTPRFR